MEDPFFLSDCLNTMSNQYKGLWPSIDDYILLDDGKEKTQQPVYGMVLVTVGGDMIGKENPKKKDSKIKTSSR